MLGIALRIAGVAIALFALDRLLLWMEARGWIYWRKVKSKSGAGDALTGFGFSDPGARHREEARREQCSKTRTKATMADSGKIVTG